MLQVVVIGAGATGSRVARQLARSSREYQISLIDDDDRVAEDAASRLGTSVTANKLPSGSIDAVVLATRAESHAELAQNYLGRAHTIISTADSIPDVTALLDLDDPASANDCRIVVGAGMMPGISDVLAAHGKQWFDTITEIHVSKFGTGGPDCARQHHRALKGLCFDWRDGQWERRPGGSGRELAWFPSPVEAADCYRAALADPLLLIRVHPDVERMTSRMAATRRDRLTMQLPMLRSPHPEGLLGATRVELRGLKDGQRLDVILGCSERPAVATGAVASSTVDFMLTSDQRELRRAGAGGLAEWVDPKAFLQRLIRRGIRCEIFVGADDDAR